MFDINQFLKFQQLMKSKNPQAVLNQLLQTGKVTKGQVEEAKKKAEAFLQIFK